MAVCNIALKGIDFSCKDSVGGIKRVWLADWNQANAGYTYSSADTGHEHPLYTATASAFKLYKFRTGNGSMNSTLNADEANGTVFVQTDLNMKFTKLSEDTRKEIAEILRGNVAAIVEDNTGNYWGLGAEHPLTLSAGTVNTGAALGDFAGYDITVQDYSATLPCPVDETVISALTGDVD